MGMESRQVVVEGRTYNIIPFNAIEAFKYQIRLAPLFSSLEEIFAVKDKSDDPGALLALFVKTLNNLDPEKTEALIRDLLKNIRDKEKGTINLDAMPSSDLVIIYRLIFELIKVNYGDFFSQLIGLFSNPQ